MKLYSESISERKARPAKKGGNDFISTSYFVGSHKVLETILYPDDVSILEFDGYIEDKGRIVPKVTNSRRIKLKV